MTLVTISARSLVAVFTRSARLQARLSPGAPTCKQALRIEMLDHGPEAESISFPRGSEPSEAMQEALTRIPILWDEAPCRRTSLQSHRGNLQSSRNAIGLRIHAKACDLDIHSYARKREQVCGSSSLIPSPASCTGGKATICGSGSTVAISSSSNSWNGRLR